MKKLFTDIYLNKKWQDTYGTESGPGSSIEYSKPYIEYLTSFIELNYINTILDLGCGDFNLMKHLSYKDVKYTGVDIVDYIIESNNKTYGSEYVNFVCESVLEFQYTQSFDLILCKDVFQHFSIYDRIKLIGNLKNYKYCIITNDYNTENNIGIVTGDYTPIDLIQPPYNLQGTYTFEWYSFMAVKKCLLLCK